MFNNILRWLSKLLGIVLVSPNRSGAGIVIPRQPQQTTTPILSSAVGVADPKQRKRVGYYATVEEEERIRAGFIAARNNGGSYRSFSEFQLKAILELVGQIEHDLNGGRQFAGAPARSLSPGRPLE